MAHMAIQPTEETPDLPSYKVNNIALIERKKERKMLQLLTWLYNLLYFL